MPKQKKSSSSGLISLIVVVYCAKNNLTEELNVCTRFISLCNPTWGNAAGLHECICEALKFMGIEALNVESVLIWTGIVD